MSANPVKSSRRVLDPNDRISEVLFGLIMVLTFTGSLSVTEAVHDDVKEMLIGALGCNIAWGIIDGVLYLMGSLAEKGTSLKTYLAVRAASDARQARELIADALPPVVAEVMQPGELDSIHQRLKQLPHPPAQARLDGSDGKGFLGVFLLVFLTTFPPTIPFMFMDELDRAMRVSNGIAIAMLFIAGIAYGRLVGRSAWGIGAFMVVLGLILVAMTIALGG